MEQAFFEMLVPAANEFSLFLDRQGPRAARGTKKKVTWTDDRGNKHDLDFVLERDGSAGVVGLPAAFIESAWRRYTKHSVNKAGEIANSLVPLRRTHRHERPFLGAIVAGEWTQGGVAQMESQGISVVHLPLSTLVDAFAVENVDLTFGEDTETEYLAAQVSKWNDIGPDGRTNIIEALRRGADSQFELFVERLREHLSRKVQSVRILPLRGATRTAASVAEALSILSSLTSAESSPEDLELLRIEVQVHYSNTDKIEASFSALSEAILWLEQNYLDK